MKVTKYDTREEWLEARKGKITGSTLRSIISRRSGTLRGFYQLVVDRIALPPDDENRMERGTRLEDDAIQRFTEETGIAVDTSLCLWSRDDNDDIALSPDGVIDNGREAVEVKCLDGAKHLETYVTQKIPNEYQEQNLQYFVVNEKLERLHWVFYDPRMPKDLFYITIERSDVEEQVQIYLEKEREILKQVEELVTKLTF